jgi:hypothetical protein
MRMERLSAKHARGGILCASSNRRPLRDRVKDELQWWPVNAWEATETLAGCYYDYGIHSCPGE